jgi:hypothetical protein
VPLHGRIAAGAPIEALEGSSVLPVPAALLGAGEHYALEVSGDLMVDAGIFDGDFALVRRTDIARDGEIVVALIRARKRRSSTCAAKGHDPARSGQRRLRSAILPPDEVQVQGKLAGCCAAITDPLVATAMPAGASPAAIPAVVPWFGHGAHGASGKIDGEPAGPCQRPGPLSASGAGRCVAGGDLR